MKSGLTKFFGLAFLLTSAGCSAPENEYDSRAVEHLDALTEAMGAMNACSFSVAVLKHESVSEGTMDTSFNEHDVYLKGPNKLYVNTSGTKGRQAYWYDGDSLSFYSFDSGKHKSYKAPETIVEMIDKIHETHQVEFPAGDFFYPTLTDDILTYYDNLSYLGELTDKDNEVIGVEAENAEETVIILIDRETHLPHRMVIEYKTGDLYNGLFTHWQANPELNDRLFLFTPPSGKTDEGGAL